MSLDTTVKTIQDIMRKDAGVDGDAQRISQLGWMLFLKIFDAREEEYELEDENYVSPIPEESALEELGKRPRRNNRGYFAGISSTKTSLKP